MVTLIVYCLILTGLIAAIVISINGAYTLWRWQVPYVASPRWPRQWMQQHLHLDRHDVFIELGCGDARTMSGLAKTYPTASFIGFELAWWPYLLAKWKTRRQKNVLVQRRNFFQADLSRATVIYCFLLNSVMDRVVEIIVRQCRPGTTVISYRFKIPAWSEVKRITCPSGPTGSDLIIYRVPEIPA